MGLGKRIGDAASKAKDKASNSLDKHVETKEMQKELRAEAKELEEARSDQFHPTKTIGEVSIDDRNELFRVKHATAQMQKAHGKLAKTARVTTAILTVGTSEAIGAVGKAVTRPSDKTFLFDELIGYELLEDDSTVTSGGIGTAIAGGVLFGGVGAIVGGMTGSKTAKKKIENLVLRIDTNDMQFPCIMITYINKPTKTNSNDYRKAMSQAQETMSALNLILKRREAAQQEAAANVEIAAAQRAAETNDLDQLLKLKQLLDCGVLTQEEFDQKKAQILG